jgi:hypothetical protein
MYNTTEKQQQINDIGTAVLLIRELEQAFSHLGARAQNASGRSSGFFDKLEQVRKHFTSKEVALFREMATLRNDLAHNAGGKGITNRKKFGNDVAQIGQIITRVLKP